MARKPTVSVVGAGRVGGAIGIALSAAGYDVVAAWSRSRAGRQRAHQFLDCPILEAPDAAGAGEIVVLAVPDDALEKMAATIARGTHSGQLVFHTSGGSSIEALAPVRESGARIGSLHPLQTFPDPQRGAEALPGASVAVTCDAAHRTAFMRVARAWGGKPFALNDEDKRLYHAAAVFASNYVVSSVWAATTLLDAKSASATADRLLAPLVRAAVENVLARGGSRGDNRSSGPR